MKKSIVSILLVLLMLASCMPAVAEGELNKDAPLVMWLPGNGGVSGMEEGATENDNQFINAIREATGYKNLTVVIMPSTEPEVTMNMQFSSGEYPDVVYVNGQRPFYLRYLAEGLWAPVDEAVAAYGPAIQELVTPEAWATMLGEDGKHYGIPNPLHTSYDGKLLTNAVQYRSDWLAELGLDVPTTPEEFKAVLQAIKAADPAGDGTTIPYSPELVTAFSGSGPFRTLKGAFGMWTPYTMVDGELQDTMRLYLKDFLTYMRDLYAEGLIDPEFLYQTGTNKTEKVIAGKTFAFDSDVWSKTIRQTWAANGTPGETSYLPPMQNIDGTKGIAQPFPVANMYMFPANTKYMNEVVDLINTFLTDKELEQFVNFGIENTHYTVAEDTSLVPLEPGYSEIIYKIYYRLWFKPDVWWNNAVLGDFHPEIFKYAEAMGEKGYTNVDVFSYMPTSQAALDYKSACDDIINEYVAKIIVGDYEVDAVDDMFTALDASGYLEIVEAAKEWYAQTGAALLESLTK